MPDDIVRLMLNPPYVHMWKVVGTRKISTRYHHKTNRIVAYLQAPSRIEVYEAFKAQYGDHWDEYTAHKLHVKKFNLYGRPQEVEAEDWFEPEEGIEVREAE